MTRILLAIAAAIALTAPSVAQQPVSIAEIHFGPALMEKADEYGQRELDHLASLTRSALEHELGGQLGAGGYILEVTILNADPNRPTLEQMSGRPALSPRSISIGGADLEGVLYSADGSPVETYRYGWRAHSIDDAVGAAQWSDARRAIRRFANEVGDGVRALNTSGM